MKQVKFIAGVFALSACCLISANTASAHNGNLYPIRKTLAIPSELKVDMKWNADAETLHIEINNAGSRRISVSLRDITGLLVKDLIHAKREETIEKNYSFSEAQEGDYSIEISDGITTVSKKISLTRMERKTVAVLQIH